MQEKASAIVTMIQVVILFECGVAMHWGPLVKVMLTPGASLAPPGRTIQDKQSAWVFRDEEGDGNEFRPGSALGPSPNLEVAPETDE